MALNSIITLYFNFKVHYVATQKRLVDQFCSISLYLNFGSKYFISNKVAYYPILTCMCVCVCDVRACTCMCLGSGACSVYDCVKASTMYLVFEMGFSLELAY